MKNLALLIAFVVLALAAPVSAAEDATFAPAMALEQQAEGPAAPATTLDQQTEGPVAPLFMIPQLIQYCSVVHGTVCTQAVGTKKSCTDVCHNNLSCTCTAWNGAKYWYCQQEC